MSTIAKLAVEIDAKTAGLTKSLNKAKGKLSTFSDAAGKAGSSMTRGLTLPILGVAGAAAKVAMDFETSMSSLAAVSGATGDDLTKLEDTAKQMGSTTSFSAIEAAEGMNFLAMAGMDTNEIVSAMPGMLDLAAASGTDLATTADIVSDALTGFGMEAKDSGVLADIMAEASSSANTSVSQLGESYKYVASVAGSFNYTAADTTTALALMANEGIKSSQAGTTLRGALLRMSDGTGKAGDTMKELGIKMADSQGNMLPLNDVIGQLQGSFAGLSEEERNQAASSLFGKNAVSGMLAVINSGPAEFNALRDSMINSGGAAKDMAETKLDNLSGSLELMKSSLEGAAISIGDTLVPSIRKGANFITKITTKFNELDESTKKNVVKFALLVASIGPVLLVVSKGIKVFGVLSKVFTIISAGPIMLLVAALAGLVFMFLKVTKENESLSTKIQKIWTKIQDVVGKAMETISEVVKAVWEYISDVWSEQGENIKEFALATFETVSNFILVAMETISSVISTVWTFISNVWDKHGTAIMEFSAVLFEKIGGVISSTMDFLSILIPKVLKFIGDVWDKHGEFIMRIIGAAFDVISSVITTTLDVITGVLDFFGAALEGDWAGMWDAVKGIVSSVFGLVLDIIKGIIDSILAIFGTDLAEVGEFFSTIFGGIADFAVGIKDTIVGTFNLLKDGIVGAFSGAANMAENILGGLGSKITGLLEKLGLIEDKEKKYSGNVLSRKDAKSAEKMYSSAASRMRSTPSSTSNVTSGGYPSQVNSGSGSQHITIELDGDVLARSTNRSFADRYVRLGGN